MAVGLPSLITENVPLNLFRVQFTPIPAPLTHAESGDPDLLINPSDPDAQNS